MEQVINENKWLINREHFVAIPNDSDKQISHYFNLYNGLFEHFCEEYYKFMLYKGN